MPSIAHIAALLVAGSWTLFALQGGGSSPFASAPLPFDELKAPPDRAFEVVMICAAVFLLAGLAAAAFLGLSKLGAIERATRQEHARQWELLEAIRAQVSVLTGRAKGSSEQAMGSPEEAKDGSLEQGSGSADVVRTMEALRAQVEHGTAGVLERLDKSLREGQGLDPEELVSAFQAGAARGIDLGPLIEALDKGLNRIEATLAVTVAPAPDGGARAAGSPGREDDGLYGSKENLEADVRERLIALGYDKATVITKSSHESNTGELIVEAKKQGTVHKGRVQVEDGRVVLVKMQPSHRVFP